MLNATTKFKKFNVSSRIPLGIIAPASQYPHVSSRLRGPVLEQMVSFDPTRYVRERRASFDVVPMSGPKMPMMAFALHLGDARLNWLADPAEPGLWDAIEQWDRNRAVPIALSREETHTFVIPLRHKLGGPLDALRQLRSKPVSDIFAVQAIEVFELDVLDAHEHPRAPASVYRHSCLLHTAKVASALKQFGYVNVTPQLTSDTDGYYAYKPSSTAISTKTTVEDNIGF
ncbi:hypothetical protein [Paraburkholderia sp. DGU8]|uniref:hypothetical protein n=1 Tax=Paraburkholderia sp. DGU8 TaxID=3161997 RepID=UPI003465E050